MPSSKRDYSLGVMFRRELSPEVLPDFARRAEAIGLDELWVVEDCFFASGIAEAAVALGVTSTINVGLGIMPAVARNAAFTAMEIATLARTYPGRFLPGIGHGVDFWMKQVGALPKSQLAALGETTEVVRRLLRGEAVTFNGKHVNLDNVKLEFPPNDVPPIQLGVRGPKSLEMSGRVSDGTLVAELSSPAYVRWAREQIEQGQSEAGRQGEHHRLTAYMLCEIDENASAARSRLRAVAADWLQWGQENYMRPLGIDADIKAILAAGGVEKLAAELPDEWLNQMTIVGSPGEAAASVRALVDAGVDSVVFVTHDAKIDILSRLEPVLALL